VQNLEKSRGSKALGAPIAADKTYGLVARGARFRSSYYRENFADNEQPPGHPVVP
jgi:hypothetical protein